MTKLVSLINYTPEEEAHLARLVEEFYAAEAKRQEAIDAMSSAVKELRRCLHLNDDSGWYETVRQALCNLGISRVSDLVGTGQTAADRRRA